MMDDKSDPEYYAEKLNELLLEAEENGVNHKLTVIQSGFLPFCNVVLCGFYNFSKMSRCIKIASVTRWELME